MTIEQGNKLIRVFMGLPESSEIVKGDKLAPYYGHYDSQWGELMPVVEKIENIELDEFKCIAVSIESLECEIKDYRKGRSHFAYYEGKTKIESVWNAVIQFIQWYNTQPPSPDKKH